MPVRGVLLVHFLSVTNNDTGKTVAVLGNVFCVGALISEVSPITGTPYNGADQHHRARCISLAVSIRRSVRGPGIIANDPNGIPGGLARMIQDLIGEDGFQIVGQMMVRGGGSTEAILELRTNGGAPISVTQLVNPRHTHWSNLPVPTESGQDPMHQVSEYYLTLVLVTLPGRQNKQGS